MASEGSMSPVRWGLLGTGSITDKVVPGARRSDRVTFVAAGSRTLERAEAYAAPKGIARAHGSYEALLDDPEVEAVYISLPNSMHHEWTMHALRAGKHVLCEKPYSTRVADVHEAYDLADARNLVLSEGFMWRHHPQAAALRATLPELGELQTIRATFAFVLGADRATDIRIQADLDGGSLMDVGCYCVSGARLLAGEEPETVYGRAAWGPTGVDLRFTGVLRFPSGVMAEFTSGFTMDHRGLEAIGDEGSAMLLDPWQADPATLVRDGEVTQWHPDDPQPMEVPYFHEFDNFSAAVRGEAELLLGRDHAAGPGARPWRALRVGPERQGDRALTEAPTVGREQRRHRHRRRRGGRVRARAASGGTDRCRGPAPRGRGRTGRERSSGWLAPREARRLGLHVRTRAVRWVETPAARAAAGRNLVADPLRGARRGGRLRCLGGPRQPRLGLGRRPARVPPARVGRRLRWRNVARLRWPASDREISGPAAFRHPSRGDRRAARVRVRGGRGPQRRPRPSASGRCR